jgi:fatty acid-binding protein DegV
VIPIGKAVGRQRAQQALLDMVAREIPEGANVRFGIVYVGEPDAVGPVSDQLRRRYGKDVEILAAPAAPVIATHLGLGAWGVAYLVED